MRSDNGYSNSEIEAFAARFYNGRQMLITPFAYNLTFLALAQNTSATQTLNIAANADFILLGLSHRAQIGAAQNNSSKTAPFVRILITDSGSNEQYTNTAVDLENYSSAANYVNPLPYPRIVAGRTTLSCTLSNYAPTAETYTSIDVMFEGVLIRAFQK